MTFPHIDVKATNVELSPGLSALIDQKMLPLGKFIPAHETDVRCKIEIEKLAPHQSGKIFRVEANVYVRGKLFRAEATEELMERAIDEVRDELRRELEKAHSKRQSLMRRGGQMFKNMLRFGK